MRGGFLDPSASGSPTAPPPRRGSSGRSPTPSMMMQRSGFNSMREGEFLGAMAPNGDPWSPIDGGRRLSSTTHSRMPPPAVALRSRAAACSFVAHSAQACTVYGSPLSMRMIVRIRARRLLIACAACLAPNHQISSRSAGSTARLRRPQLPTTVTTATRGSAWATPTSTAIPRTRALPRRGSSRNNGLSS